MKKIACLFSNSKLLEKVKEFCEVEKFELLDFAESKLEYDISILIFLTDIKAELDKPELKELPVCFVGSLEKADPDYLSVSDDFSRIHLRYLVDAVCHGGVFENNLANVTPLEMKKKLEVKNDIYNIEKIVYALTKEFVYFIDFNTLEKVRVGLAEMLTNAIEHGNFGISGEEKRVATDEGKYYDLINAKMSDGDHMAKVVKFTYELSEKGVNISIEDEGAGFDVDAIPDPTDIEALMKLHGRGILITRMYFDEVVYNVKGNKVELIKRF
jgi:anti-sigma regulatory factor (Ser/Thr protein kinase)